MDDNFHKTDDIVYFRNDSGQIHRVDGPAVIFEDGTYYWFINGVQHREGGPAVCYPEGFSMWYKYGVLHNRNGPAVITNSGEEQWWLDGREYHSPQTMPLSLFISYIRWKIKNKRFT
jgi:hypothetical protein